MPRLAQLVVSKESESERELSGLVMAWARDTRTGQPRYILELDAEHRGAKCGCECPSCGLALTAVNAAKDAVKVRPHFRHPKGAERQECLVLAARAAVLQQLQETGWLQLPRRLKSATAVGLSGESYEAWVETPPERLRVRDMDCHDRAAAVITFDDGRQLRVVLTGTPGQADNPLGPDGRPVPTVFVHVEDGSLAGLSPGEIRQRLQLVPDAICWHAHWDDAALEAQALMKARAKALDWLDESPEGVVLPEGMDPGLRRETVLHMEVKRILEEQRRLMLPSLQVRVEVECEDGRVRQAGWASEAEMFELDHVELEHRFGNLIPDVTCKAWPIGGGRVYWPLFIEVTVTNSISEERLQRIHEHGQPTVEIDLSLAGGWVNRDMLKQLVIDSLSCKRWLFHPDEAAQRQDLKLQLEEEAVREKAAQLDRDREISRRRERALSLPLSEIAREYLEAVTASLDAAAEGEISGSAPGSEVSDNLSVQTRLDEAIEAFRWRGYKEAGDTQLIGWHGILSRLLTCKLGRPVGYRLENVMGVLNAIRLSGVRRQSLYSLYLIAVRVYQPPLSSDQWVWFEKWATEVRDSVKRGEQTYLRDPVYDRFLSILFPEMAESLAKGGAKRVVRAQSQSVGDRRSTHQPGHGGLLDTKPTDGWLKGRDLEAWRRANPGAVIQAKLDDLH